MRATPLFAVLALSSAAYAEPHCVRHSVHKQWPCAKSTHTHLEGWNTLQLSAAPEKICIAKYHKKCLKTVLNPHLYHSCKYFGPLGQGCGK